MLIIANVISRPAMGDWDAQLVSAHLSDPCDKLARQINPQRTSLSLANSEGPWSFTENSRAMWGGGGPDPFLWVRPSGQ